MPISKTLVLASALTPDAPVPDLRLSLLLAPGALLPYLLLAWGLMSLAKGLHVGQILIPDLEILGALINAAFVGATLLVLAAAWRSASTTRSGPATW